LERSVSLSNERNVALKNRIQALKALSAKKKLSGYIITNETNMLYFTEATGASVLWIPVEGENLLYVYGVNYESVNATARDCHVKLMKRSEDPFKKLADQIKLLKPKSIGFDTLNALNYLTLRKGLKRTRLKPLSRLVHELRAVKDSSELASIKKAAEITDKGVKAAVEAIKPGVREYTVAAEIEYAMRKLGSEGVAFDTIVASGTRSAFPHGGCTDQTIQKGQFIVLDLGARYNDYRADLTRTLIFGKPTPKQKKIYEIVKEAQQKAFETIKAGVNARDVDAAARKVIQKAGFGNYFVHGLGHGVGLDVHEAPTLDAESKERLKVGNVVTDEPGIYIVDYGGVRIEDTVLVKKKGSQRLTRTGYDLVIY
jgi:Xaa-Pro aminopeptidase